MAANGRELDPRRGVLVGRWGAWVCVVAGALAAAGCSPAFNWRDVRAEGSSFRVTLPCKPESAQRTVGMAGHAVSLSMLSCDTGGLTFAVASLKVPEGMAATEVVQAWQHASQVSLKVPAGQAQPWVPDVRVVPGSGVAVLGWRAVGARPDGSAVQAHVAVLTRGDEVAQVAVYGDIKPEVMAQWLEGVVPDAKP